MHFYPGVSDKESASTCGMEIRAPRSATQTEECMDSGIRGWHSRGYLPHFDGGMVTQSVTFRLMDSFPLVLLDAWKDELGLYLPEKRNLERVRRIEAYLDTGQGEAWLRKPEIAMLVEQALLFFDDIRYRLYAWVVMPNHVHALFTPMLGWSLSKILHSWKRHTAHEANILLQRHGSFWYEDYYDRFIRSESHFDAAVSYIETNPVNAGLCSRSEDWPWSSARLREQA